MIVLLILGGPPKSRSDCGHTERCGKGPFGDFWLGRHSGLFSKSDPL